MKYKIIPMERMHLEGIKAIDDLCFETPWSLKSFETEFENPLAVYFVALDAQRVIGYCGYWWIFDEGQITNIAVHPDYRGKGIAQSLLETMIEKCARTDVSTLTLEVRESNRSARHIYEKYGFLQVGLRPKYYGNKEDAVLMTKQITQAEEGETV